MLEDTQNSEFAVEIAVAFAALRIIAAELGRPEDFAVANSVAEHSAVHSVAETAVENSDVGSEIAAYSDFAAHSAFAVEFVELEHSEESERSGSAT